MRRRIILLASVAMLFAFAGCRHKCHKLFHHKDNCCPPASSGSNNILLPPTAVPTTPGATPFPPPAVTPAPSFFPPPATTIPPKPAGPDVLLPDPLPGNPSSRVSPAPQGTNFLGAPVAPTKEPPKAANPTAGLPGYAKVKDGLYTGGKPTLDGFDALKRASFRTVIYLHAPGADVGAVKGMADTRGLEFVAIETTPETLATASKTFDAATSRSNQPAYVFADDATRAGAVWYLHFRNVDTQDNDVARLRAKPLGLNDQSEEGKAFWLAIQKILETK